MDQGDSAIERTAVVTPLRALLLVVAAVIVGLGLSVLFGSAPAQASEGDGGGVGDLTSGSPITSVSTVLDRTAAATTSLVSEAAAPVITPTIAPLAKPVVATVVPAVASAIAPISAPVSNVILTTVSAVDGVLGTGLSVVASPSVPAAVADAAVAPLTRVGTAATPLAASVTRAAAPLPLVAPIAPVSSTDGTSPTGAVLTSGSTVGAAAAMLSGFLLLGAALRAARRRAGDDALPSSPVFETDTSPA